MLTAAGRLDSAHHTEIETLSAALSAVASCMASRATAARIRAGLSNSGSSGRGRVRGQHLDILLLYIYYVC